MNIKSLLVFLFIINLCTAQNTSYEVFNTSINSKFAELGITFINDTQVIFASSKKNEEDKSFLKERRKNNRQFYLEFYNGTIDKKGDIIETDRFSNDIKSKFFEADISFTPDQKTVYFTWNNLFEDQTRKNNEEEKTLKIVKASLDPALGPTNITFLPVNSDAYSVRSPIVSSDGKKLFFVSNMPGGLGGGDIYYCTINTDGSYGPPVNLGANVNTEYDDQYPTVDANGTLYFSTIGKNGRGGLDIFKSEFKNNTYQPAENLGFPINSKFDEFNLIINTNTNSGFFVSNRDGGVGNVDIYGFGIKKPDCEQAITFDFINKKTKKQVANVKVTFLIGKKEVDFYTISNNFKYNAKLLCETEYIVKAEKENYEPFESNLLTTNDLGKLLNSTFELTPIPCDQFAEIEVRTDPLNLEVNNCTLTLTDSDANTQTQPLDSKGKATFTVECNTTYNLIAEADNFETSTLEIVTDTKKDSKFKKLIILKPKSCTQLVEGTIKSSTPLLKLQNPTIAVYLNGVLKDKQTIAPSEKFKFDINCNGNYKLVATDANFETAEIEFTTSDKFNSTLEKNITLKPAICQQLITGIVTSADKNTVVKNGTITIYEGTKLIDKQTIGTSNNFNFKVNCNSNYTIKAEATDFESSTIEFSTNSTLNEQVKKDIQLAAKKCTQLLAGTISTTGTVPLNPTVSIYKNGKLIEQQNTTSYNFTIECDATYKITASNEQYITSEVEVTTSNAPNTSISKNIVLKPLECNQFAIGKVTNSKNQPLSAKSTLFLNGKRIEEHLGSNFRFKLDCNKKYEITLEALNHETGRIEIDTDNNHNEEIGIEVALIPSECNQLVKGIVKSNDNKGNLKNATVSLFKNNVLVERKTIDESLLYEFQVTCNSDYKIVAEAENFESNSIEFKTDNSYNASTEKNLTITPKDCTQLLSGTIKSTTTTPFKNGTVSLFVGATLKEKQATTGAFKFNIDCNTTYKLVVEAENFDSNSVEFKTDNSYNASIEKNLTITPKDCTQLLAGTIKSTTTTPFKNGTVSLFVGATLKEKQATTGAFKFNIDCNTNYKLVVEAENFDSNSVEFKTDNSYNASIEKNMSIVPKPCNQLITGIIKSSTSEVIKTGTVSLYAGSILKEKQQTKGAFSFKVDCATNYKLVAEAENFEKNEVEITTNDTYNNTTDKTIVLTAKPCNQLLTGTIKGTTLAPFKNGTVSLLVANQLKEKQETTGNYKFTVDCNTNYKIITESENFENNIVEFTTNTTYNTSTVKNIVLTPKKCTQTIAVLLFNKKNNQRISMAKVALFSNNQLIEEKNIVNTRPLEFTLDCSSTYKLVVTVDNFEISETNITTNATYFSTTEKTIQLVPKPCKQELITQLINSETNNLVTGAKVQILKDNKLIKSLTLAKDSIFKLEVDCESTYTFKTNLAKFDQQLTTLKISDVYNYSGLQTIALTPSIEFIADNGQKFINTNTLYFELDKADISVNSAIELNKVVNYLNNHPQAKIEVTSHTDSRAPDGYNLELSEQRAQAVANYIISKGIDSSRVTGKGYGETQPVNNCTNGVKCSEAEHQQNRRTEFFIKN